MFRKRIAVVLMCAVVAGCGVVAEAASRAKGFSRKADPVIVSGKAMPRLEGVQIRKIRVYTVVRSRFVAVPFQIDERTPAGELVFTGGPQKGADVDAGLLDGNDELVVMAKDTGVLAKRSQKRPAGTSRESVVKVTDPLTGASSYVYVFAFDGTPPARAATTYVSISGDGNRVNATNYAVTFGKDAPIGFDSLAISPAGGGTGRSSVDRLKIRAGIEVKMADVKIDKSESDFQSELLSWTNGPVRVIRRTSNTMNLFWKFSTPSSIIDNVFYFNSFEFPTEVNVPFDVAAVLKEFRFRVITDGNARMQGKRFLNSRNPRPVLIDGKMSEAEKRLDRSPYRWSVVYGTKPGDTGAWLNTLEYDSGLQVVPMLYYMDDVTAAEPPEREPGQYGAIGYDLEKLETLKKGVWRLVSVMYNIPKYRPGAEREYLNIRNHPLRVTTVR